MCHWLATKSFVNAVGSLVEDLGEAEGGSLRQSVDQYLSGMGNKRSSEVDIADKMGAVEELAGLGGLDNLEDLDDLDELDDLDNLDDLDDLDDLEFL